MSGGGGGDGHGELGISKTDLANSGKRLSKTDGYVSQAEWSKEYFGGRLLGQLLTIICLVLFFAWYFGAGYFAVYAVVFLVSAYIAVAVVKRRKLKSLREKQLSEYRSKQ